MSKKLKVLAVGCYGVANIGDELLLLTLRDWVVELGGELTVISLDPENTEALTGISAVSMFDMSGIARAMTTADLFVMGGGGIFQDYHQFSISSLYDPSIYEIASYARPYYMARQFGIPTLVWAYGVGPLNQEESKAVVRDIFSTADSVSVRDEDSATLLRDGLGIKRPIVVGADPVWASRWAEPVASAPAGALVPGQGKKLALIVRQWDYAAGWDETLLGALREVLDPQWTCVWVGFQTVRDPRVSVSDRPFLEALVSRLGDSVASVVVDNLQVKDVAGLLSQCDAVLSMRLHGCILSHCLGLPTVALEYDAKVGMAMAMADMPANLRVDINASRAELVTALQQAMGKDGTPWCIDRARHAQLKESALAHRSILAAAMTEAGSCQTKRTWQSGNFDWLATWTSRDASISGLRNTLAERDEQMGLLNNRIQEVSAWGKTMEGELVERDKQVGALNEQVEAVSAWGKTLQDKVVERDAQVGALNAKVEEISACSQAMQGARDGALAEKDLAIAERNAALAEKDAALAARDAALVEAGQVSNQRDDALRLRDDYMRLVDLMRNSLSWRLTMPLRFFARLLRHGLVGDDRRRVVGVLRRLYHRVPLPAAVRYRVSQRMHSRRRGFVLSVEPQLNSLSTMADAAVSLEVQQTGLPDYIFWGVIDWHFRHQRPQQLAQALADSGRRVFYVSESMVDNEAPGFEIEPLGDTGRLFSIRLFAKGAPVIYHAVPTGDHIVQLRQSVGELLAWANTGSIVSMVQHPFWLNVAAALPEGRLVYDCMDHHEGFGNVPPAMIAMERALLASADLTVTTSTWLDEIVADKTGNRVVIRNAGEFAHFARAPGDIFRDPKGRRIIGYYGAIAEWFDIELVAAIAKKFPDCCILLIGSDTVHAKDVLGKYPNVMFTGEIPYAELPRYLHAFDVCMLPFKVIPLTLATNPVKVYEYLSAGKPVVVVDLPEMAQFGELVDVARNHDEYCAAIERHLALKADPAAVAARQEFGRNQTWGHRATKLIEHVESAAGDPPVSVIVVTYNNLELTKACLASLDAHSHYGNIEIIVVDNASSDGSPEFLAGWVKQADNRKLILNTDNRGFAAANNQGLAIASGDYLVLLNNDTYVTPGWVRTMVNHMRRNTGLGLLGPVTNNIGNEARIEIAYESMDEMLVRAAEHTRRRIGRIFPLRTAAFFCVMIPRKTYEAVGPLDEAFGRGFFEDDDYCRRVEQLGLQVACAEDVFIHHQLSASFNKLKQQDRQKLFEENKKTYEAKWGAWVPHTYEKQDGAATMTSVVPAPSVRNAGGSAK